MAAKDRNPLTPDDAPAAGPYLAVEGVEFAYAPGTPVLRGFSMGLARGRLACLLGPNGSGKTTLLRILVGLLDPQAGQVRLAGTPLADYPRAALARRVAYVPQETLAAVGFTALETVLMGRSPHTGALGFESPADWRAAREALRRTDTERFAGRNLDELSGGERQRVIIARALAQEPDLILLDEPTSFLDIKHQHDIYGLLAGLVRDEGKTVVAVSHDLSLAAAYADDLVLVDEGRVAASGPPEAVIRPEVLSPVYDTPVEVRTDETTGRPYVLPRPPR
ncbi:MAG TPA: ABC transporter ATP-binding protein [Phycisphaerae bacterium]|nr:ABC transporter ATP-binding protein [Phycisphaerae bacterium]